VELHESSVEARLKTRAEGDAGPRVRKRPWLALAVGVGAFALVFAITSGAGPGLDPDAMAYLGAATSMAQQGTLRVPSSEWDAEDSTSALTTWPPVFSIAMAIPRAAGVGSLLSARIVNAVAAFITATVLFLLFGGAAGTVAAVCGVVAVFVTTAIVGVHLSVLSEPLFLACLALTLVAMVRAEGSGATSRRTSAPGQRDWTRRPLVAGIPAALAAMVRYAGVCAPAAVVLWFFFSGRKSLRARFADAAEAAVVPAIVIAGWLLRSMRVGHGNGSPELALYGHFGPTFREATQTFAEWLAPGMYPPILQLIVALALAIGVLAVVVNGVRRCDTPTRTFLTADALLLSCYLFVLISARVLVVGEIPFDFRLLAPAILLAEGAIVVAAARYLTGATSNVRRVVIAACALWFAASLTQSARDASEAITEGSDFASSDWRASPTLEWVRSRSGGRTLFSNWPAAIYFRTSRIARDVPQSLDSTDLRVFGEILERSHGALVAFSSQNPDYPPGNSIARALGLVEAGQFSDGTVWVSPTAGSR
jgi:Dolichyl-phosphate-mannose-protein mannosyltransferase